VLAAHEQLFARRACSGSSVRWPGSPRSRGGSGRSPPCSGRPRVPRRSSIRGGPAPMRRRRRGPRRTRGPAVGCRGVAGRGRCSMRPTRELGCAGCASRSAGPFRGRAREAAGLLGQGVVRQFRGGWSTTTRIRSGSLDWARMDGRARSARRSKRPRVASNATTERASGERNLFKPQHLMSAVPRRHAKPHRGGPRHQE
jgi:hypothetical protein